jgi:phage shock protein A
MNSNNDIVQVAKSLKDMPSATTDYSIRINDLIDSMSLLEKKITNETKIIKEHYSKASSAMKETQNYFLNGIQDGQPAKSYLLTCKGIEGIEVLGEEVTSIDMFIDNVLHFANEPSKQIQVLKELAMHLQKVNEMLDQTLIETI